MVDMVKQAQLLPGAVSEILVSVSRTGALSLGDRYGLMAAICDQSLQEDEQRAINRIVRSVLRGQVKLDESFSSEF